MRRRQIWLEADEAGALADLIEQEVPKMLGVGHDMFVARLQAVGPRLRILEQRGRR